MKKILSLLLMIILISLLCLPLLSCNPKPDYDYAFITDLHIIANSTFTQENYDSYAKKDKLVHLSEAILNSLVDELIVRKYEYVFVGGDITEYGDEASHLAAAAAFKRLEEGGVEVFVINGNHDLPVDKGQIGQKITPARFKEIYKDFGYENALAYSPNTLSYVANLNKKYRLIGVDSMIHYGENDIDTKPEAMSESHIEWLKKQVEACKADKVTPIVFTHDTLINHYPEIAQVTLNRSINAQLEKLVKYFADNGANYVFAGHDHLQDTNTYITANNNTLYEIAAGSMVFFPAAYKEMSFKKNKITINSRSFDKINLNYLPAVCPDSIKEELKQGLQSYCYKHFNNFIYNFVSGFANMVKSESITGDAKKALDIVADGVADKVVNNPFYIKDENNNVSLERIMQSYGLTIPQTEAKNIAELAVRMAAKLIGGDENLVGAPDLDLVKYSIFSIFYYLNEVSPALNQALPQYPEININLNKLFSEGILECYDSKIIGFTLKIVESFNSTIASVIKGFISDNFDQLGSEAITSLIKSTTNGIVMGIGEFFEGKNMLIGKFIDEGIWGNYAKDYVLDRPLSDSFLEIKLK